jgi:hypothetical protein
MGAHPRGIGLAESARKDAQKTNLRSLGVDVKVAQELLLHANAQIPLNLYTQAISSQKREAIAEMPLPAGKEAKKLQHL